MRGNCDDARNRGQALGIGDDWRGSGPSAAAPSEIDWSWCGGNRAVLGEGGLQVGILSGMPLPGCSSVSTTTSPLRGLTVTGRFRLKAPSAIAACARRSDSMRIAVLRLTRQLVFVGGILGEGAHRPARFIGIFQPVEEHMVIGGVMARCARRRGAFSAGRGALVMLSMPPAMTIIDRSAASASAAHDHASACPNRRPC
jgi:hypothetical protein